MHRNLNHGSSSSLPWWTWILPFFIANLGTWLSIWFKTDPGASLWYLPTALGIVMIYWWGPRVLLGVYLNAIVCVPLWDLPRQWSLLYGLPETIEVGLSWLLFIKLAGGKCWLPNLKHVGAFLLLGSIIPTFIANSYLVIQLYLLGNIAPGTIWTNWQILFSADLATQLVIAVPLLVLLTRIMREQGWTQIEVTIPSFSLLPQSRSAPRDGLFIIAILGTALFMIVGFPSFNLWILYGFLMIVIATRYGVNMAVIGTSWIGLLAFLVPVILTGRLGLSTVRYGDFVSTNFNILFLCGVALLTGRAISDLFIVISERRSIENELRDSEELHRVTLSNISDAVFLTDDDGKFTYVCSNVHVIFGYSQAEAVAMGNISNLLGEDLIDPVRLDAITEIQNMERQITTKTGNQRVLLVNIKRVSIRGGTVLHSCRDITERKQAEEALRANEARFRAIIELSPVPYALNDEQQNITYLNHAFTRTFGYDLNDIPTLEEWWPRAYPDPEYRKWTAETWQVHLDKAKREGTSFEPVEVNIRCKDGATRTALVGVGSPIDSFKGEHLVILYDITERKQADLELAKRATQLRALASHLETVREEERTRIAREIHDEFGQFLTALKMDLAWVSRRLESDDEKRERLHRASALVDDNVRLVQRIATELRPGLLDDLGLTTALDWLAQDFSSRAGVLCELALPEQDLGLNRSLNTTLFRIFQEALTNIARHARASRVDVRLNTLDGSVFLQIDDNGRGITDHELNHPRSLGLLGLHERVAQWAGELSIRGEAGKGTSVKVRIPLPSEGGVI